MRRRSSAPTLLLVRADDVLAAVGRAGWRDDPPWDLLILRSLGLGLTAAVQAVLVVLSSRVPVAVPPATFWPEQRIA
jgi:hypothetical protein